MRCTARTALSFTSFRCYKAAGSRRSAPPEEFASGTEEPPEVPVELCQEEVHVEDVVVADRLLALQLELDRNLVELLFHLQVIIGLVVGERDAEDLLIAAAPAAHADDPQLVMSSGHADLVALVATVADLAPEGTDQLPEEPFLADGKIGHAYASGRRSPSSEPWPWKSWFTKSR